MRSYGLPLAIALVAASVAPTPAVADPTKAPKDSITSVRLELMRNEQAVRKFVETRLMPTRQKVTGELDMRVTKAAGLLNQIILDPEDKQLRAAYEEALSDSVGMAIKLLDEYSELEGPTMAVMQSVTQSLKEATHRYTELADQGQANAQEADQRSQEIEQQLSELATRYQSQIESGDPLPPDVALQIRMLQIDLNTMQTLGSFGQTSGQNWDQVLKLLIAKQQEVSQRMADLKVAFYSVKQSQVVLGRYADLKANQAEAKQLAEIADGIGVFAIEMGAVDGVMRQVQRDLSLNLDGHVEEVEDPMYANKILAGYLKEPMVPQTAGK